MGSTRGRQLLEDDAEDEVLFNETGPVTQRKLQVRDAETLRMLRVGVKCNSEMGSIYRMGLETFCSEFELKKSEKWGMFKLRFTWGKIGGNYALSVMAQACAPFNLVFGVPDKPFYAKKCVGGKITVALANSCPEYNFKITGKVYMIWKLGLDLAFFFMDFGSLEIGIETGLAQTNQRLGVQSCWWRSGEGWSRRRYWSWRRRNTRHCNYNWQRTCDIYVKGYITLDLFVARVTVSLTYWVKTKKLEARIKVDIWKLWEADWGEIFSITLFTFWFEQNEAPPPAPALWLEALGQLDGKRVEQSSTAHGGVAERAIDGNRNSNWGGNSCTHTNWEDKPWWQIDLGQTHKIESVWLQNRGDCCGDRLNPFDVLVDGVPCATGKQVPQGQRWFVACVASGRYIRVQKQNRGSLTICEVGVKAAPAQ